MEKEDVLLTQLRDQYRDRGWFYDVGYDQYGRLVVYVNYECHETNWDLPDCVGGKQLLVHFAASIKANKDSFLHKETNGLTRAPMVAQMVISPKITELVDTEEQERELELSVRALTDELDRLEKLCGSNILQDIFYEIRDGKNAVTNLSTKFPEVRQKMQKLYDKYGFDVIYEELDG